MLLRDSVANTFAPLMMCVPEAGHRNPAWLANRVALARSSGRRLPVHFLAPAEVRGRRGGGRMNGSGWRLTPVPQTAFEVQVLANYFDLEQAVEVRAREGEGEDIGQSEISFPRPISSPHSTRPRPRAPAASWRCAPP